MAKSTILNSVEEVIEDFRNGRIVIVVDDEDREKATSSSRRRKSRPKS
jgi:lauroyl/myristoyl acyltransferase